MTTQNKLSPRAEYAVTIEGQEHRLYVAKTIRSSVFRKEGLSLTGLAHAVDDIRGERGVDPPMTPQEIYECVAEGIDVFGKRCGNYYGVGLVPTVEAADYAGYAVHQSTDPDGIIIDEMALRKGIPHKRKIYPALVASLIRPILEDAVDVDRFGHTEDTRLIITSEFPSAEGRAAMAQLGLHHDKTVFVGRIGPIRENMQFLGTNLHWQDA